MKPTADSEFADLDTRSALLDSVTDGFVEFDAHWRFRFLNKSAERSAGRSRQSLIGQILWEAYPELRGGIFEANYLAAQRDGHSRNFEFYWEPTQQWFDIRVHPSTARIVVVLCDITALRLKQDELAHANRDFADANVALEARNRALQDFAHVVSHDLHEPLRKIRVFGERLNRASARLDEDDRGYLQRMMHAAERMQSLIDGLLSYSMLQEEEQRREAVDLNKTLADVLRDLDMQIAEKSADIQLETLPTILANPMQMRQLLQNLLQNALKFVRPGERPQISIGAELVPQDAGLAGPWCRLFVRDRGIGFDPAFSERIFAPFQRLQGRGQFEGSGIGLAIVRRIVEQHGGSVRAESSPGNGACFHVVLPFGGTRESQ